MPWDPHPEDIRHLTGRRIVREDASERHRFIHTIWCRDAPVPVGTQADSGHAIKGVRLDRTVVCDTASADGSVLLRYGEAIFGTRHPVAQRSDLAAAAPELASALGFLW